MKGCEKDPGTLTARQSVWHGTGEFVRRWTLFGTEVPMQAQARATTRPRGLPSWKQILPTVGMTLLGTAQLEAQCAMCREAAAAQTAEGIAAFNLGILVLGVPPMVIMALLAFTLWRYRDGVPMAGSGSSSSS